MPKWLVTFHFKNVAVSTKTVEASSAFTAIVQARAEFILANDWTNFLDLLITNVTIVSVS